MLSSVSKKTELQRAPTTLIPEERPPRRLIVKNQSFNPNNAIEITN